MLQVPEDAHQTSEVKLPVPQASSLQVPAQSASAVQQGSLSAEAGAAEVSDAFAAASPEEQKQILRTQVSRVGIHAHMQPQQQSFHFLCLPSASVCQAALFLFEKQF